MGSFKPLSKGRAEEIRQAMERSRSGDEGMVVGPTGEFLGPTPVGPSPDDRRNTIGKYDTHYAS